MGHNSKTCKYNQTLFFVRTLSRLDQDADLRISRLITLKSVEKSFAHRKQLVEGVPLPGVVSLLCFATSTVASVDSLALLSECKLSNFYSKHDIICRINVIMSGFSDFLEDLRTSNYVRLWTLFWIIGLIAIIAGSMNYSSYESERERSKAKLTIISGLQFPRPGMQDESTHSAYSKSTTKRWYFQCFGLRY